jgi:hypothetical protein
LDPQGGVGSRIAAHFVLMTVEATYLLFIMVGITADGGMAGQAFKAGRAVNRLLVLAVVNVKRNRFSILKTAPEIGIGMAHQAVGITAIF